jgi:hypothetical protein
MPQMNIHQRLSAKALKEIMQLAEEREKLTKKVQVMLDMISGIDQRLNTLYNNTYTDPQTYVYVPGEFAHEALAKSPKSLRTMVTKSRLSKR